MYKNGPGSLSFQNKVMNNFWGHGEHEWPLQTSCYLGLIFGSLK